MFREFAFQVDAGLRHLRDGTRGRVILKSMIDSFRSTRPDAPVSIKSVVARDEWLSAVHMDDNQIMLQMATTYVKLAKTT
jgi:hypothetical protein